MQVFDAELYDPIVRRTLLFPAGSAPETLAGLPVTALPPSPAQQERGLVTVATAFDRRAVKAFVNDGRARYYGLRDGGPRFAFAPLGTRSRLCVPGRPRTEPEPAGAPAVSATRLRRDPLHAIGKASVDGVGREICRRAGTAQRRRPGR